MDLTWHGSLWRHEQCIDCVDWQDIWVIDHDTGIVYQGLVNEASGDMEGDVKVFLGDGE